MKRLIAYLCALALAWAPALTPASITLMGAGKIAVVAGGGSVTYDVSDTGTSTDIDTVTTGTETVANVAGRYALFAVMKDDSATTINSATFGGNAMTAIAAEVVADWNDVRSFECINTCVPTGVQGAVGTASAASERLAGIFVVYNGVHTTTPRNSTTSATGATTSVSTTVTTVTNGKAICSLVVTNAAGTAITITPGAGVTVRQQTHSGQGSTAFLERDNNGGSTVVAATLTVADLIGWRTDCYGIQPP